MPHSDKAILSVIRAAYDRMTPIERTIADYFLGEIPLEDLSAKTITGRLYVSKASLSRFANRCGIQGVCIPL